MWVPRTEVPRAHLSCFLVFKWEHLLLNGIDTLTITILPITTITSTARTDVLEPSGRARRGATFDPRDIVAREGLWLCHVTDEKLKERLCESPTLTRL